MSPARIAVTAEPPDASTAVAPNCAAPAKTKTDMTIAAVAPITGSATIPNETPASPAATANGSPVRIPSRYVRGSSVTCAASHGHPFEHRPRENHRPRGRVKRVPADDAVRRALADARPMELDIHALETSFDAVAPRGEELVED